MDEVDSIGGTRIDASRGGDSEVQRTMLELLNQLDGFEPTQNIKAGASCLLISLFILYVILCAIRDVVTSLVASFQYVVLSYFIFLKFFFGPL